MLHKNKVKVAFGVIAAILFLAFGVPLYNITKYKATVARSLSQALGREVTVGDVELTGFPRPGLKIRNLAVADDPELSAEPILTAADVTAYLRLSSLWRLKLEIGQLTLDQPSFNLVRGPGGRWNVESLLERARQTPTAPTDKRRPEARTRFPYVESVRGRINLKIGPEKKVYALTEADFSLWLASEDEWRMRLRARPIRTDANLSDVGELRVNGSARRAATLRDTPVWLNFTWEGGQLGQLSALAYGRDRGWRGSVEVSGSVIGKPEDLKIVADATVNDFRRYDIISPDSFSLAAHCEASYDNSTRIFQNISCHMPAGTGNLLVKGSLAIPPAAPKYDLSLAAEQVPAQFVVAFARHAKKGLPSDLNATGALSAAFSVRTTDANPGTHTLWAGSGESGDVLMQSKQLDEPLKLLATTWHLEGRGTENAAAAKPAKKTKTPPVKPIVPDGMYWRFDPIAVAMGGPAPMMLDGWFARKGYRMSLKGDGSIERLLHAARAIGLEVIGNEATGLARSDLQISGEWAGFQRPLVTGEATLTKTIAVVNGFAAPLQIAGAKFVADDKLVAIRNLTASFKGTHSNLTGGITLERCDPAAPCPLHFDLKADQINLDELNGLVNPKAQKTPWYAIFPGTSESGPPSLKGVRASGHVTSGKLVMKSLTATKASADVTLEPGKLTVANIIAETMGGKYAGELTADFTGTQPAYHSSGTVTKVALVQVGTVMQDHWATGTLSGKYEGTASGWSAEELAGSASGSGSFEWRDGALTRVDLDGRGELKIRRFTGSLELRNGVLTVVQSKLETPGSIYLVSGTASLERQLELNLARNGAPGYSLTGTLAKPKVTPVPGSKTEAALR